MSNNIGSIILKPTFSSRLFNYLLTALLIAGTIFLFVKGEIFNGFTLLIVTLLFFFVTYKSDAFEIDKKGILYKKNDAFHKWDDIKYAYIDYVAGSKGSINKVMKIETGNNRIFTYGMDGIPQNMQEFSEIVQTMSGRNIGARYISEIDAKMDSLRNENKLTPKEIEEKRTRALKYMPLFDELYERKTIYPIHLQAIRILLFFIFIIAFLAVVPKNECAFLTMSSIAMVYSVSFIYNDLVELFFRKQADIQLLDKAEYKEYKEMAHDKTDGIDYIAYLFFIIPLSIILYFFFTCDGHYFRLFTE